MVFDDDPYWFQKKTDNKPIKKYPSSKEVMTRMEREPRAPEPSPLLKEYMEKERLEKLK